MAPRVRRAPPTLPDEIIVDEILKRLPLEFVARFRRVSKLWNFLLSQPNYIQPLLNHSISQNFNDDYLIFSTRKYYGTNRTPVDGISILSHSNSSAICLDNVPYPVCNGDHVVHMLGSINGLVCMACFTTIDSEYHFILWNPAMNLSKKILGCPTKLNFDKRYMFGFGWDSVTNNYKIMVQSTDWVQAEERVVYLSETDSWINIVGSKFSQPVTKARIHQVCWRPSVIVKGICYWDHCAPSSNKVFKFEPKNNELTYFMVPRFRKSYTLVNLNDRLARVECASAGEDIMDVYFFNEECCTWSKIYTTNIGIYDFKIKSCFRNGRMVVLHMDKHREYSLYDPKSNETKGLACNSDDKKLYICYFDEGFSYTPSLVALEGMKSLHP